MRNKHDLLRDFDDEYLGYKNNMKLIYEILKNPDRIHNFLPKNSSKAFDEWKRIISNYNN